MRLNLPPRTRGGVRLLTIVLLGSLLGAGAVTVYLLQERNHGEAETAEPEKTLPPVVVHQVGNFLVNVSTSGELRYLRVEVATGLRGYRAEQDEDGDGSSDDEEGLPTLRADDEAVARDLIVKILSDTSFVSLRTVAGREQTRQRIKSALADALRDVEVDNVLFLEFVMQ